MTDEDPDEDNYSDSDQESRTESSVRLQPTLSDILLTPEEKLARQVYRLNASKCCVEEAWRMYRRVTNSDFAIEPANLNADFSSPEMITRMGVLYDPTAGLRMQFLKNKFAHLLTGFRSLRQAAYKPFIRCQKPQRVDIEGQGKSMPAVAKAYHPEVYVTYTHPSTFAYKEKWNKIFNSNFLSMEDMLRDQAEKDSQTWQLEVQSTKRIRRLDKPRDLSVEKFDLEDIPLDKDGNPIGRSVGICEWCGMSILPIPSDYTLSQEWNFDTLYCCDKYRQLIEETKRATAAAEVEFELMHLLIDTRSKNRKLTGEALPRYSVGGKKKNAIQIIAATALANMENEKTHDKCVDTQDLPWDPTETHLQYASQRLGYEDQPSPPKTSLKDMNILLELEEVYTNRATQSPPAENKALPGNVSQNSVGI